MLKKTAILSAAALFSLQAAPASAVQNGLLILKMSGSRGWTISCEFDREDDTAIKKSARGRGDVETFAVRDVTGGRCEYEGPRRGELRIRFDDENNPDACPLTKVAGECIRLVSAGRSGEFSF